MSDKVLTVSVAAYNAQDYLEEVLNSFIDIPNMNKLEVFVIDDGGKDDSLNIAKKYEEKYPDVFHAVHKDNGGWGSTVNYSIEHATGKYFRLLDGDDYYSKENLNEFINVLCEQDADLFLSSYASFVDGMDEITIYKSDNGYNEGETYLLSNLTNNILLAMHAVTVKTSILQKNEIQLKEHCLYRDMEYTAKILTYAETVQFYHKPVYYYRLGRIGQSVSKSSYIKHMDEHASIVCDILDISSIPANNNKKHLLYKLADGACAQQYAIYFYSENTENVKGKLVEFDRYIRKYPDFYNAVTIPGYIKFLRKVNYTGYNTSMKALLYWRKIKSIIKK